MKLKFQINGISCGGCVARVKNILEEHPNIEKAQIFLAPKGATLLYNNRAKTITIKI